jgi:capsular exopolysaccharide synthesis family protein
MQTVNITFPFENHYFINEAFNALSTNVRFSGPDIKVITLTSCFENEGKSSIVFTLAKHLASEQKRVLLLDADMRNSVAVSKFSDLTNVNGLSELISGMAPLEDVLYHSNVPGLDVIFAGSVPPNPVALLGHTTFATLVKSLSEQYDYVLIDTPPLTPVIDAALTAAVSDGILHAEITGGMVGVKGIHGKDPLPVRRRLRIGLRISRVSRKTGASKERGDCHRKGEQPCGSTFHSVLKLHVLYLFL